jgi:O-antigen/teichoic acid export membrane protein
VQAFKQWPIYFIGRILPAAIAFFGIALYTRLLDPSSYGTYVLLLSTTLLIGTTCFAWLRIAALRMMATIGKGEEPDYAATIVAAFIASSLVVAATVIVTLHVSHLQVSPRTSALTALAAIASGWFELNVTVAQSRLKLGTYSTLQAARAIGILGGSLVLIHAGLKVDALLGGFIIGNSVGFAALASWKSLFVGRVRREVFHRMFRFGWPSSASSLSALSGTFQQFALQAFGGVSVLGVFGAVNNFAGQTIGLLIGTASLAGQPLAFRARDRGVPGELEDQLRNNARLVFGVGVGATAGLIALAQPLADLFLGPKFRVDAGPLIVVFALATLIGGMRASYFEQGFEIMLKTRPIAILTALRVAAYIGLSVALIPRFGSLGAAFASLISEAALLVVTVFWTRNLIHMPIPLVSFAKMTGAAFIMAGCIQFVPGRDHLLGVVLAVLIGIAVYAASFALLYLRQVRTLVRTPRAFLSVVSGS